MTKSALRGTIGRVLVGQFLRRKNGRNLSKAMLGSLQLIGIEGKALGCARFVKAYPQNGRCQGTQHFDHSPWAKGRMDHTHANFPLYN